MVCSCHSETARIESFFISPGCGCKAGQQSGIWPASLLNDAHYTGITPFVQPVAEGLPVLIVRRERSFTLRCKPLSGQEVQVIGPVDQMNFTIHYAASPRQNLAS
jgi:hypothetical protein